jgi:hypothetical protein
MASRLFTLLFFEPFESILFWEQGVSFITSVWEAFSLTSAPSNASGEFLTSQPAAGTNLAIEIDSEPEIIDIEEAKSIPTPGGSEK